MPAAAVSCIRLHRISEVGIENGREVEFVGRRFLAEKQWFQRWYESTVASSAMLEKRYIRMFSAKSFFLGDRSPQVAVLYVT
ncbi:hypothetical protein BDD12DRAFT_155782 [Trichophaea hybrida]|nr:hypothetical protein BDD12DRAFT_155782 [Trichophaea hybrida]